MGTERLKPLHNFKMPPGLRWGNQRQLRCMKIHSDHPISHHHRRTAMERNGSATPPAADDGIAAVREKVMLDIQTAAHKMKHAILNGESAADGSEPQRPWNLRTRRAAVGENGGDWKGLRLDFPKPNSGFSSATAAETTADKSPMPASGEKREREKFSVGLSKKEIEEDFMVFGQRLPRRPKKRPRTVQKQLDTLFPGLWLTEVTADMYKVTEPAP